VGGFRRKSRSGENVYSHSPGPFSSKPPHKLCSCPRSSSIVSVFSRIRRMKSGPNGVSWDEGWRTVVCGRGLGVDKSQPQGAWEEEPADRGIQGLGRKRLWAGGRVARENCARPPPVPPDTKGPRPDEASPGIRIRNCSLLYKSLERPAHRANRTHQDTR